MMKDLGREHVLMNALCDDLVARAESGEWRLCDAAWDAFARKLRAHMASEERELFPQFLMERPDRLQSVVELKAEHAKFRVAIERLGISVQLRELRARQVHELASQLELHSQRENLELYPWSRARATELERSRML